MNLAFEISLLMPQNDLLCTIKSYNSVTSPLKEGMLQIFNMHKTPLLQPGLIPRALGLMASTQTITPLR
jgi:hypothetical protein